MLEKFILPSVLVMGAWALYATLSHYLKKNNDLKKLENSSLDSSKKEELSEEEMKKIKSG